MKKSIRIAAALCAAVFALPVLAGCDNGEVTDEETVSGNGGDNGTSGNTGNSGNGGTSGGDTGNTENTGGTGDNGNGGTSGGNTGTSQGGTSGGDDTGNTGNTGGTGDSGNGGSSGGNTGTSQGGTSGGETGNTGNTGDTGDNGNGGTSGGNTGNVAQNLFKGKTIEYIHNRQYDDGSWYERKTSIAFVTDTTGRYVSEYRGQDSDSDPVEESKGAYDIVYSLESLNGKNFLFINVVDSAVDAEFDKYVNNYYHGISAETKGLLRKTYVELCYYYELRTIIR